MTLGVLGMMYILFRLLSKPYHFILVLRKKKVNFREIALITLGKIEKRRFVFRLFIIFIVLAKLFSKLATKAMAFRSWLF